MSRPGNTTRGPWGSPLRAAASPPAAIARSNTALRDNQTARRNRRSATIKTERGLAIPAARRNHPLADAAGNLILIDARLSPRSSRYKIAISAAQIGVVCWGILLMHSMSEDRKLDAEARDRQTAEYAREARERHEEAGARHQEAMAALTALIQRTSAPGTS